MNRRSLLLASLFLASFAVPSTTPASARSEMAPTGVLRTGVNFGTLQASGITDATVAPPAK